MKMMMAMMMMIMMGMMIIMMIAMMMLMIVSIAIMILRRMKTQVTKCIYFFSIIELPESLFIQH